MAWDLEWILSPAGDIAVTLMVEGHAEVTPPMTPGLGTELLTFGDRNPV